MNPFSTYLKNYNVLMQDIAPFNKDRNITVVLATKYIQADALYFFLTNNIHHFGENKAQELLLKEKELTTLSTTAQTLQRPSWHFIGHLQKNKLKKVLPLICCLHSVDNMVLLEEIQTSFNLKHPLPYLIQVNTSLEKTKFGLTPNQLLPFIEKVKDFSFVKLKGLMTMGPNTDNTLIKPKQCFKQLRSLLEEANRSYSLQLSELSMGMSSDYKIALDEGATMIRPGKLIFHS